LDAVKKQDRYQEDVRMDMEIYDQLVESIYDAPFMDSGWQAVISQLQMAFDSTAAGFFVQTKDNGLGEYLLDGVDDTQMRLYQEHYAEINPWFTLPGLMQPGAIHTDYSLELIHHKRSAFIDTEFYQDWCRPQDLRHAMGGSLLSFEGNLLNFTIHRPQQAGYYTDTEIQTYRNLNRHLLKAVQIGEHFVQSSLNPGLESVLDRLRLGILFLDRKGRILDMNRYAKRLIQRDDSLFEKTSRLEFHRQHLRKTLAKAITHASSRGKSSTFSLPRDKQSPLSVCVIPTNEKRTFLEQRNGSVTLFISDPEDREIADLEALAKRWNLTPLEAEFTLLLVKGNTVNKIAEKLQLTENTARWYSKQIMGKVGVKRQVELSSIMMKDIALLIDT
jgi:DNA-binding CsgD family transcriptional regulator